MKDKKVYKAKKDIPAIHIQKGDLFEFNKEGYTHQYMDDVWVGLPEFIIEENDDWFEEAEVPMEALAGAVLELTSEFNKKLDDLLKRFDI